MDWQWGPWVGIFPMLGFLLQTAFWVAAVAALIVLLRRRPGAPPRRHSPALDALEERYARGEIDRDEFLERRAVLDRAGPAGAS